MVDELTERKAQAKAWLYSLLAKIETCDNVIGDRSEMGNTTKIVFIWDVPNPPTPYEDGK